LFEYIQGLKKKEWKMSGDQMLARGKGIAPKATARLRSAVMTGTLAFSLLWSLPAMAAPAALPAQQDDAPIPLNLGEMASGILANGESVAYLFDAPADTTYVITTGDDEEAQKFDLILTSEDGEEVYNDIFETVQFDLDDGEYTLELVAVEDGEYSVFVTAGTGDFSENYNRPGDLVAGSFVTLDEVSEEQYATVEIPETDYWQQAFIIISGGEEDDFSATISDDSYDTWESVSSTLDEGPLRFFTRGGLYDLSVQPAQEGAMTVVVLTSGPFPALAFGEAQEEAVSPPGAEKYYVIQPSEAGRQISVSLTADDDDIDLYVSLSTEPGDDTFTSTSVDGTDVVNILPTSTDPIFVHIYTYDASSLEEPLPFTIVAEEGDEASILEPGELYAGEVDAGTINFHLLDLPEGELFVTVFLLGANPDVDLDLRANVTDENGGYVASLSSSSYGSAEAIATFVSDPTTWQIEVSGAYADDPSAYTLLVGVQPAAELAGE